MNTHIPPVLRSLSVWLKQVGVTPVTGWRWRQKGWLKTTNIMGRVYVTDEAISDFTERAVRGDFAKDHVAPTRFASHNGLKRRKD